MVIPHKIQSESELIDFTGLVFFTFTVATNYLAMKLKGTMFVLPIFLPVMDSFGVDRLWLVGVTAVILQTCFMTPPFGFALFYIKGIVPLKVKISEIYKGDFYENSTHH